MGASISNVAIRTYENNVRHLAQQGITRLLPWVQVRSEQSKSHSWELMAKNSVQAKTRSMATPDNDTQWSRRVSVPISRAIGDLTDRQDIVQMAVDPNSNYAKSHGMAMRRAHDTEIITRAVGTSADDSGTPIAFPATQDVGSDTATFSFDLITEVTEKFMLNDIDPDEPKVFVISPAMARRLLQLTEATSGDYNALKPLTAKGYIESWMGYTWIVSTLLTSKSTGVRYSFAMTRQAMGFNINDDIHAEIAMDPSMSFAWRVYCESTFGAIRVEDQHLVRVATVEAAAT